MNVVVHFDEIFLKGKNQIFFIRRFLDNIKRLFPNSFPRRTESGVLIENISRDDLGRLELTPGIGNFAEAVSVESNIESMAEAIFMYKKDSAKSFRITATRSDKNFPMNSVEVEKELGAIVQKNFGWKVDLKNHDLRINVDIGTRETFIYGKQTRGAGGLPVGATGKIMCLISGGIDSPVATYKMMRRGAEIEIIHFQNQTNVSEESAQKIFDITKLLARFQPSITLHIISFADLQKQIIMKIPAEYRIIISKRCMFKIAELYAKQTNCGAICTGDSLGQVASQTLENTGVIYSACDMPVFAPLIGDNKSEITDFARKLGTLEISNRPYEDCCSLFISKHPQTKAQKEHVDNFEKQLDLTALDKTPAITYHISM